eukprot:CAMPEP_0202073838 /NCGR_PEP_ID=MMETSP0964-20121228/3264_1 /ASSEMBLY_ACC=CAM_ASM_000500 /TAXON_ID=4773 /ORGANISM="Schizochytrium aggregatum, Strain ATCC28209" /LENGTH=131 /DNA_ID=CAMNT_0048640963 /DNA_START=57 /DNA_END=449 /DNA_ORIENTATION=-
MTKLGKLQHMQRVVISNRWKGAAQAARRASARASSLDTPVFSSTGRLFFARRSSIRAVAFERCLAFNWHNSAKDGPVGDVAFGGGRGDDLGAFFSLFVPPLSSAKKAGPPDPAGLDDAAGGLCGAEVSTFF